MISAPSIRKRTAPMVYKCIWSSDALSSISIQKGCLSSEGKYQITGYLTFPPLLYNRYPITATFPHKLEALTTEAAIQVLHWKQPSRHHLISELYQMIFIQACSCRLPFTVKNLMNLLIEYFQSCIHEALQRAQNPLLQSITFGSNRDLSIFSSLKLVPIFVKPQHFQEKWFGSLKVFTLVSHSIGR